MEQRFPGLEIIQKIEEVNNYSTPGDDWEGYIITTSQRTLRFLIDQDQQCCESWGHLCSPDDLDSYIGSWLLKIECTTDALETRSIDKLKLQEEADLKFVSFTTDRGVFQLCAYTDHNGYYGHHVRLEIGTKRVDLNQIEKTCLLDETPVLH